MCLDHAEMLRCHEEPELLNVAPPKMFPDGLLEKAKSLLGRWPCDHTVTTHQTPGEPHETTSKRPTQQDEDVPGITVNRVSHFGRTCWGPGKSGTCSGIGAEPC